MGRHRISYRLYPGVAQLVARVLWEHEAAGSNPVTRTTTLRGLKLKTHCSKLIERLGSILHTNTGTSDNKLVFNG